MVALPTTERSYGTDMTSKYKVNRVEFGDGMSQRKRPGLNSVKQRWRINYSGIDDSVAETLRQFFDGLAGVDIIEWTPHGQSTELKWTATDFRSKPVGHNSVDCSVVLTQEFDL